MYDDGNREQAKAVNDLVELDSGQVFRIRTLRDFFRKLHREKQRFEKAESDREGMADQVDAAINFAITGWHMTDWVWNRQQHELREYFNVRNCKEFKNEMRRRCLGLAVCDVIANAAKHGGAAYDRDDRPEIETVLIAHPVAKGAADVEFTAVLEQRQWSLKIKVDGRSHNPIVLLNMVFRFWYKFIQQHCASKNSST